jgi:hypothetical protein
MRRGRVEEHFRMGASQEMLFNQAKGLMRKRGNRTLVPRKMKRRGRGELKEILFNQAKGKIGYEKPHWRKMKEGRVEEHFRMGASQGAAMLVLPSSLRLRLRLHRTPPHMLLTSPC